MAKEIGSPHTCTRCRKTFEVWSAGPGQSWCRPCKVEYGKAYYAKNYAAWKGKYYRKTPKVSGPLHGPRWPLKLPTSYQSAHQHLRQVRGRAAEHPCANDCGRQAAHWAYTGGDPNERNEDPEGARRMNGRGQRRAWSENIYEFYVPLCRKCHMEKDRTSMTWRNLAKWELEEEIVRLRALLGADLDG